MKNLIILAIAVFSFTASFAQKKDSPIKECTFKVGGVCGDCEKRIESAALRTKGVKLADWDRKSKDLKVVYNSKKVSEEEIQKSIAMSGHETPIVPSDSVSYSKLPACCRYKDGAKCKH
ncbi:MAG: heavy-metal-associated domain-containing protein [Flavobacteriales bacterium]|nr:heavy-metal-associated domain-containing protein [Flavobacteriales bacterium]